MPHENEVWSEKQIIRENVLVIKQVIYDARGGVKVGMHVLYSDASGRLQSAENSKYPCKIFLTITKKLVGGYKAKVAVETPLEVTNLESIGSVVQKSAYQALPR